MKILYLLTSCQGLGVARRLAEEGNTVYVYVQDSGIEQDPTVHLVDSWREFIVDVDLVIGGSPGFQRYEDVFKKFGKPYIGASKLGSMLMQDKLVEFLELCGVSKSGEEPQFGIHGFFNGRKWVEPWFMSVLDLRLAAGDLGPIVGSMGAVLVQTNKYADLLEKLRVGFSRMGLRDMVTILMSPEGVTGIGCGITYDVMECIIEGMRDRVTDLLFELASGTAKNIDFTDDTVICVKLSIPPFPYMGNSVYKRELAGISPENLKHIFLDDVEILEDKYLGCSSTGCVLKATARGRSLREARRRVYRTLDGLDIDEKQYRIDIGERAQAVLSSQSEGL